MSDTRERKWDGIRYEGEKKREIKTAYESYSVDVDDFEGLGWGDDHEGH